MKTRLLSLVMLCCLCPCSMAKAEDHLAKQVSGEFVFAATWSDDAVKVCFDLDGVELACATESLIVGVDGAVGQHTVGAPEGTAIALLTQTIQNDGAEHRVTARACDLAGNCSDPSTDAFLVDFVPPAAPTLLDVR